MPEMDSGRNNTVPQNMAKYFSPLNTSIDCYDDNLISLDQDFILLTFVCICRNISFDKTFSFETRTFYYVVITFLLSI